MCVYSMVMDHYQQTWPQIYPWVQPVCPDPSKHYPPPRELTPEEKEAELQKLKDLIERARKYDRDNNEPECELESKRQVLRDMAKQLGIDIEFV